ncbi:MAG TPA: NAD-dependent epimerase/dehydratase family protein [Conexibacter sp.]|jgi:nucleoside-diphosphate-sugar epimerase|nr:NAD-dependent epimerase/dehydratase family protein [Conexibacter sp.]
MTATRSLVTGAAGFIGAALARRLIARGDAVTLLSGPGSDPWRLEQLRDVAEVVELDLRDADTVARAVHAAQPELVFHLAAHGAYSWQRSLPRMIETNVAGTAHVAEAALDAGARAIVNAGSSSEYGLKDHAPPEHELPEPNSAYAVTKASATLLGGWLARQRGAAITTLRLYSAYGPWEEPRRLMPALVAAGLERRLPPLADPAIARDFVYVEDVVDAFLLAAAHAQPGAGAVYNVGGGRQTSLRELAEIARRTFAIEEEPAWAAFPAREWDTDVWVADARRAADELGWRARTPLEAGLARFAQWMDEQPPPVAERYRTAVGAT